jgi:hypothetical protein
LVLFHSCKAFVHTERLCLIGSVKLPWTNRLTSEGPLNYPRLTGDFKGSIKLPWTNRRLQTASGGLTYLNALD